VLQRRKAFVCLCEDVTAKDIRGALTEGFDSLETVKRYSTVTMGPCQGKMCHTLSARVHAALSDQSPSATGLTTSRPPYQPVPLAALAGPHLSPVRRTPIHDRHEALGATWTDMGDWKRPLFYTNVDEECRAVREAAGIIDVSTLGKLELAGAGAGEFLDWLHPNRFSDLRTGRVRYRVMCDDAGIILDDGTVARLDRDRFFLTTGTTAFEAVEQWLAWWLAGSPRDVQAVNVTSQYAAVNLAGPRAREVMGRLTALDVSSRAMPYLAAVRGEVAGVPALILRIGFVGELGYEIHVPADYGAHLWDAVMDAGREVGIRPFGVEAQRVLRLEKQHIIPGQDTDALSNPLEAGLDWAVKAEKPDFIGRDSLARVAEDGRKSVLVGFEVPGGAVPAEGAAIVEDGRAVGRVTSCKWSPVLGRAVGLGWVPARHATDGTKLTIRLGVGTRGTATEGIVRVAPFYDPDGARLRN
jgi:sarcosine oxidase subunit alpha